MSRCPSHPFLDCADLYTQSSSADEPTPLCPPSHRSSLQPPSLLTLLLPHPHLPDSVHLLVVRLTHCHPPPLRGTVVPREEALTARQVEDWGLEGVGEEKQEGGVAVGEVVTFERRHVGWVVGVGMGKGGEGSRGAKKQREEEKKRVEEAREAAKGSGWVKGSEVVVTVAQGKEDEHRRKEGATEDRQRAAAGEVTAADDSFEYEL